MVLAFCQLSESMVGSWQKNEKRLTESRLLTGGFETRRAWSGAQLGQHRVEWYVFVLQLLCGLCQGSVTTYAFCHIVLPAFVPCSIRQSVLAGRLVGCR